MSNADGAQSQWVWSTKSNDYVTYDHSRGRYITATEYNSGLAKPARNAPNINVRESTVRSHFQYSGSPPGQNQNYVQRGDGYQPLAPQPGPSRPRYLPAPVIAGSTTSGYTPPAATPIPIPFQQVGYDQRSGVQSIVQRGPPEHITDPRLLQAGIHARGKLKGTNSVQEKLYPEFKVRDKPKKFFKIGRVFIVLWTEPAGQSGKTETTLITSETRADSRFGEQIFSKVRRFVVVRESDQFCSALPIVSYNNQGVAKIGTIKSDHGIIYIGKNISSASPSEAPQDGEEGMRSIPIRIDPESPHEKLEAMSRINYGKVYTVEHNVKVRPVGSVHPHSVQALLQQFGDVWFKRKTVAGQSEQQDPMQSPGLEQHQLITLLIQKGYTQQQAINIANKVAADKEQKLQGIEEKEADEDSESESESEAEGEDDREDEGEPREAALNLDVERRDPVGDDEDEETKAKLERQPHWERAIKALRPLGYSREQAIAVLRQRQQAYATQAQSAPARESDESEAGSGEEEEESSEDDDTHSPRQGNVAATLSTLQNHGLSRKQAALAIRTRTHREQGQTSRAYQPDQVAGKGKVKSSSDQVQEPKSSEDDSNENESSEEDEEGDSDGEESG